MELKDLDNEMWENGQLGRDAAHVRKADPSEAAALDDATAMQLISIRLPRPLLNLLKALAEVHGVGYQPMARDVLGRWAQGELEAILERTAKAKRAAADVAPTEPLLPERKVVNG